ncbi:hypothetical protein DTO002I6_9666 [Penicillium roqueforti]|nr:hypothetical protein DTO002I6_9666 [Penicillium roqueforti]
MAESKIASTTPLATVPAPIAGSEQVGPIKTDATAAVNNSPVNGAGEQLPCQWACCTEKSPTAEALHRHVCDRHIGCKSTNNLNLTCQWGTCNTTTVKRNHITSHILVHIPLKPHKCDFCGRAFKRPQDRKKHVQTHADNSDIRSPESGIKHFDKMIPRSSTGFAAATHYFESPLNAVNGGYTHGAPQYYQPHTHLHPANLHSYGKVCSTLDHRQDGSHDYGRKRGYDALNEFFGDLKRRQFDPNSYAAVGQRLLGLQTFQLPILNGHLSEYEHMPASVAVDDGGGYRLSDSQAPGCHLPPMSSVRTKNFLITIDQFLEQMQNTIYDSSETIAAAGFTLAGLHSVHGGLTYRAIHSPPTQLPASHVTVSSQAPMMAASASPFVRTSVLTSPSSAQSYISQRSPISMHHVQRVSPLHESGGDIHPLEHGPHDHYDRRRYTGGILQRGKPAKRAATESYMGILQDSNYGGKRSYIKAHLALHISGSLSIRHSSTSPEPNLEAAQQDVNVAWVKMVRILGSLRRLISVLLEAGSFNVGRGQSSSASISPTPELDFMDGVEAKLRVFLPRRPRKSPLGVKARQSFIPCYVMYEDWASKNFDIL